LTEARLCGIQGSVAVVSEEDQRRESVFVGPYIRKLGLIEFHKGYSGKKNEDWKIEEKINSFGLI
jgi:hypothetical protein